MPSETVAMSSWSYTAPTVTQEEMEAEQRALSDEERRQIDEIYGLNEPILEAPQLIADKIDKMNEYLELIDEDDKEVYLTAQEKCPEYCNSEDFRLMFLRADKFDAEKAASRLVAYWEEKLDVFGPDCTYRCISIDDLIKNPEDVELLESSALYILPEKDAAGRGILFVNRAKLVQFSRESKWRVLFYLIHCLVEDNDITQKKGFVFIAAPPESLFNLDRKFTRRAFKGNDAFFPCWMAALHLVVPAVSFTNLLFLPVWNHIMGRNLRKRRLTHSYRQSAKETGEKLKNYGIGKPILPIELGGSVEFEYGAWLDQRRASEAAR